MVSGMGKKPVSLTLDEDLIQKVDELARKTGRSRSDTVNMFLKVAVEAYGVPLHEGVPIPKYTTFEGYLRNHPEVKVIFDALPENQQQKVKENWKREFNVQ